MSTSPRLVSAEYPRRGRGVAATRPRNIHAAKVQVDGAASQTIQGRFTRRAESRGVERVLLPRRADRAARPVRVALRRDVEVLALDRARRDARLEPLADPRFGRLAVLRRKNGSRRRSKNGSRRRRGLERRKRSNVGTRVAAPPNGSRRRRTGRGAAEPVAAPPNRSRRCRGRARMWFLRGSCALNATGYISAVSCGDRPLVLGRTPFGFRRGSGR